MSAADKYGAILSADAHAQVKSAGQVLADKGAVIQSSLGNVNSPAHTPATKYGAPVNTNSLNRSLSRTL